MIKVDLITGFLGAGKTTFIKHYVKYLSEKGKHIAIIENDYGAINVDRMILQDELGDQADVEMVIGGDQDCRIRRFKSKLISMAMLGYDRVIVEPSGVYDVDEFFDILHEEPLDKMYEIGNVIAIVDAKLPELSKESDYVLASEVAYAGSIVLSRVQEASSEEIQNTIDHVQTALKKCHSNREIKNDVLAKDWNQLEDEDYAKLTHSEYDLGIFVKKFISENHFKSLFYYNKDYSLEEIKTQIKKTFADESCGHVIRIKGFALEGNQWKQINATREETRIEDVVEGQKVIIIIGEDLDQKVLDSYWEHL